MQLMAKLGGGEIRNVAQRRFVSEKTKKKKWGEKQHFFMFSSICHKTRQILAKYLA